MPKNTKQNIEGRKRFTRRNTFKRFAPFNRARRLLSIVNIADELLIQEH